jgi:hypothetical protein
MAVSRFVSSLFVLLALVAAGCGSSGVTDQPAANFAGEYSFIVTGGGGTCVDPPRATGSGVETVAQSNDWATSCFLKDTCDGETCRAGSVVGNVFTSDAQWSHNIEACEVQESHHMVTTLNADGTLTRRQEQHLEFVGGNCSAQVLPCDAWQTSLATPCTNACYEGYCPGGF